MAAPRLCGRRIARCIDRNERFAIQFKPNINTIASGARYFANNHPVGLSQGVGKGAFANVATTDDSHLHFGLFVGIVGFVLINFREPFEDHIEQDGSIAILGGAHRQDLAATQAIKVRGLLVKLFGVGFVGDTNDGDVASFAVVVPLLRRVAVAQRGYLRQTK